MCETATRQSFKTSSEGPDKTKCLSYDVASESEITSCIKIDKPIAVYRFSRNVMKRHAFGKTLTFSGQSYDLKIILMSYDTMNLTFMLLYY